MPGIININKDGFGIGNYGDLSMSFKISLEPIQDDTARPVDGPNPTHNVYADVGGGPVLVGAAWTKKGKKPNTRTYQKNFYSLSLDDPSFPRVLHLHAFPTDDKEQFEIVWSRQQERNAA